MFGVLARNRKKSLRVLQVGAGWGGGTTDRKVELIVLGRIKQQRTRHIKMHTSVV